MSYSNPRPILKRYGTSSDDSVSSFPHTGISPRTNKVHFPTDSLARVYLADDIDRSPILVRPNVCALPERGCPGRTYSDDMRLDSDVNREGLFIKEGRHVHSRAHMISFEMSGSSSDSSSSLPSLTQDSSDASEDSDDVYFLHGRFTASSSHASTSSHVSPRLSPNANTAQLSFLPHPHSSSPSAADRSVSSGLGPSDPLARSSRSSQRMKASPVRQRRRSRSRARESPARGRRAFNADEVTFRENDEEGCLGGF